MDLLEQLQRVKLKKTEGQIKDYSDPKLAGFLSNSEIEEYQNKVLDVNTEVWMDALKEVTFPTQYCHISPDEAQLFIKIYETNFRDKDNSNFQSVKWKDGLSPEENRIINSMIERLQNVMEVFLSIDGFTFVKTSSRSAKDAPIYTEKFVNVYKKELGVLSESQRHNENTQITCLLKAAFQAMKMKSAWEVIDTFVTSERIYQDMLLAMKVPGRFNENFVIRRFIEIDVDMEFRGFVYNGILTALSQYNYLIYSERLYKTKKDIEEAICLFFEEKVKILLNKSNFEDNYIIDFAICHQGNDMRIWVIEINPFMETTDGALYSWQHEKNMLEGHEGFSFRITEKPKPGSIAMMPQSVRNIIKTIQV